MTTVAGFGARGPWSGWAATDLVLQATGGIMQISGTSDREPLKHGLQQSLWCGGLNAAYATLAAHLGGGGVHVDLSLQECVASELVLNEAHYAFMGAVQGRRPPGGDPLAGEPLPTADGLVSLQTSGLIAAKRLADLFGDPRLDDPRFASTESRTQTRPSCRRSSPSTSRRSPGREFFLRASREGYLSGCVQTPSDLLSCPQLEAREAWHAFDDLPGMRFPAKIASLSATPQRVRGRAPALGGAAPDWAPRPPRAAPRGAPGGAARRRPLDRLRRPLHGRAALDLGAEVIKVEAPHRLDQTRALFGHPFLDNAPTGEWWDRSGAFHVVNRGKRSLTLDLSQAEGREVLLDLLGETDVLLDNFTPRVLRGWGMTAGDLRARYPAPRHALEHRLRIDRAVGSRSGRRARASRRRWGSRTSPATARAGPRRSASPTPTSSPAGAGSSRCSRRSCTASARTRGSTSISGCTSSASSSCPRPCCTSRPTARSFRGAATRISARSRAGSSPRRARTAGSR